MASGTGSQQQHKISPRKFSEKIALLNKKEREGNAKFEEIIKEVHATRNQQQQQQQQCHHLHQPAVASYGTPYANNDLPATIVHSGNDYCDELEEVYENLMKSVGQYEHEIQIESPPLANDHIDDKFAFRSASAGLECKSASNISSAALNSFDQRPVTSDYQNNDNNNIDLNNQQINNFIPCEQLSKSNFSGHNITNLYTALPSYSPQQDNNNIDQLNNTSYRARVISFGSATNYKYLCAGANTATGSNHQPARYLNQPNWPVCSQNQDYLYEPTCDKSRQKSCSDPALHVLPPTQTSSANTIQTDQLNQFESANVGSELPGIKICAIEDESALPRITTEGAVVADNDQSSRNSSLPDISNLQFGNNSPEKQTQPTQMQQNDGSHSLGRASSNQTITNTSEAFHDSCQALDGSWISYGCLAIDNMDPRFETTSVESPGQQQLCWSGDMNLYSTQHEPKVNNLLSNSDCGLTTSSYHHPHDSLVICTSSELYNNIIRSRSHSNIDYLAKQNKINQTNANGNGYFLSQHQSHQEYEQLSQLDPSNNSQCGLQPGQTGLNNRRIVDIKAHELSISPLGSSSNLNSPQSDLNSPGSSTAEYCEAPLVYPNTISQSCCQSDIVTGCANTTLMAEAGNYMTHYVEPIVPNHPTTMPMAQNQMRMQQISSGVGTCIQQQQLQQKQMPGHVPPNESTSSIGPHN